MKISVSPYLFCRRRVLTRAPFTALLIVIGWAVSAGDASATTFASYLGDMICNMQSNIHEFGNMFTAVAYIAGAALIGTGIHMLVRYNDNPQGMMIHQPLTRIGGGAALLASPSVSMAIIETFWGYNTGGGLGVCTGGTPVPISGFTGLDVLMTNLVANITSPLRAVVSTIGILAGIFMTVRGLMKASKYGTDPREHSMTKILANLIVGAVLMAGGQAFDTILDTAFGFGSAESSSTVVSWNFITTMSATPEFILAVQDAGIFFELVGLIAFVRGWMIIKSAVTGDGQATLAQGLTHVFGGVLAMNIFRFLEIMDATFGTNLL